MKDCHITGFDLTNNPYNQFVMKIFIRFFFSIVFSLVVLPSHAGNTSENVSLSDSDDEWKPVIEALIKVESNGNSNATYGASVGGLQITPVLVAECNNILRRRKLKRRYKLSDRFSRQKSIEMFLLIQSWFNPMHDIEQAIRSWNGGMHYSMERTQRYFDKVMSLLKGTR